MDFNRSDTLPHMRSSVASMVMSIWKTKARSSRSQAFLLVGLPMPSCLTQHSLLEGCLVHDDRMQKAHMINVHICAWRLELSAYHRVR